MNSPLKVFVIGPSPRLGAPNHLPWLRYTVSALRRIGHTVTAAVYRESWATSPAIARRVLPIPGGRSTLARYAAAIEQRRDRQAIEQARTFRPDLTIVLKGEVFSADVFAEVKRLTNGPMTTWWVDNPWAYPQSVQQFTLFDRVFLFDRSYMPELATAGITQTAFLPCACDETVYHPRQLSVRDRDGLTTDVAFVASYYPQRAALARAVADAVDVGIWGNGWSAPAAQQELQGRTELIRGGLVDDRMAARIYRATKVGLNIHHPQSRAGGVNTRTFELLATGVVPLVDRLPGIDELLEPDREVACYDSPEHARSLASALVQDISRRAEIAERGRQRVLAEHTYVARMRTLCSGALA